MINPIADPIKRVIKKRRKRKNLKKRVERSMIRLWSKYLAMEKTPANAAWFKRKSKKLWDLVDTKGYWRNNS